MQASGALLNTCGSGVPAAYQSAQSHFGGVDVDKNQNCITIGGN